MTRRLRQLGGIVELVVMVLLVFGALIALIAQPATHVAAQTPPPAPKQFVTGRYSRIVEWDPADRRLTVTRSLPRDAFICIRDVCRFSEEWVPER